jgi:hypothetical protein
MRRRPLVCHPLNKTSFRIAGSRLKEYDSREKVLSRLASEAVPVPGLGASPPLPLVVEIPLASDDVVEDVSVEFDASSKELAAVSGGSLPTRVPDKEFDRSGAGQAGRRTRRRHGLRGSRSSAGQAGRRTRRRHGLRVSSEELAAESCVGVDAEVVAAVVDVLAAAIGFGPSTSSHVIEFLSEKFAVRCRRAANSSGSLSTRQNLSDLSKALTNLSTCNM